MPMHLTMDTRVLWAISKLELVACEENTNRLTCFILEKVKNFFRVCTSLGMSTELKILYSWQPVLIAPQLPRFMGREEVLLLDFPELVLPHIYTAFSVNAV